MPRSYLVHSLANVRTMVDSRLSWIALAQGAHELRAGSRLLLGDRDPSK
jgi:hypothetical protein